MSSEKLDNKEIGIWYDPNNQSLYKKLTEKEVFEWLQTSNEFIWKAPEQKEKRLKDKIKELYKH